MTTSTLLSAVRVRGGLLRDLALAVLGTGVIALSAHVQVPMYPVPMTMQSLTVLLVGAAYGWRLGGGTLALYLAEGAVGLPVLAKNVGIAAFVGPTAGYLFGFVAAAALVGWLAERGWTRTVIPATALMLIGHVVLFVPGVLWLANLIGMDQAIAGGLTPFLVGTVVKIGLGAALLPALWSLTPARRRG